MIMVMAVAMIVILELNMKLYSGVMNIVRKSEMTEDEKDAISNKFSRSTRILYVVSLATLVAIALIKTFF